jgi:hypothetical protein
MILIVLLVLVVGLAAALIYIIAGLVLNNRTLSSRAVEAEGKVQYILGELHGQSRYANLTDAKMADEVLMAYKAQYPNS